MQSIKTQSVAIDAVIIVTSGIFFQCVETLCRTKVYPMIAKRLFKLKSDIAIYNFSKQAWKFTWHAFCLILELIVLMPSDFWSSTLNPYIGTSVFWTDVEELPSNGIRFLHLFQIGYYCMSLLYMLAIDPPNDLLMMSVHHVVTLALLWMSYLPSGCWKIGSAVLFIHEVGDVTLTFTKSLHYVQLKTISEILFVFHILIWIWFRLICFPLMIWSIFVDVGLEVWQIGPSRVLQPILLILHIFWTRLMFGILFRAVVKKEIVGDPRDKKNPINYKPNPSMRLLIYLND